MGLDQRSGRQAGANSPVEKAKSSVNRLQLLSWLEAYRLTGRDGNLRSGARISSDTGFSRPDVEYPKAPQLNAIALGEGSLHAFENSFHGRLGLGFGNASLVDHFVDDVQLNHRRLPAAGSLRSTKWLMLRDITEIVNGRFEVAVWVSDIRSLVSALVSFVSLVRPGVSADTGSY